MSFAGTAILLALVFAFVASMFGLVTRKRSVLFTISGAVVILCGGLGALHAWGESQSVGWTFGYLVLAAVGIGAITRQAVTREKLAADCED